MEKLKRESHLKTPIPMNWSTGPSPIDRLVNTVNDLTFQLLYIFSFFLSSPYHFQLKSPFFMPNAKGILIFGRNLTNI